MILYIGFNMCNVKYVLKSGHAGTALKKNTLQIYIGLTGKQNGKLSCRKFLVYDA